MSVIRQSQVAVFLCLSLHSLTLLAQALRPDDFVDLQAVAPSVQVSLRYATPDNFMGVPVEGYNTTRLLLTRPAARALAEVQAQLEAYGLGLRVYDGYRPQMAVDHFVRWAADPAATGNAADYFPNVAKSQLFAEGYIAARSGHSRGSTVDLTVIDAATGESLDMGTPWDYFDPASWPASLQVPAQQRANRLLLRRLMLEQGFLPYEAEWWHFTLRDEPYPDTYFTFAID